MSSVCHSCLRFPLAVLCLVAIAPVPAAQMVAIPGGEYTLGHPDVGAVHTLNLAAFEIDRFEVSNADFADFLNTLAVTAVGNVPAGEVCPDSVHGVDALRLFEGPVGHPADPWVALDDPQSRIAIINGEFAPTPGFEDHPVAEVTWAGAVAFCEWRGARLPTEAEWEATARGREGRTYPWGEAPPSAARAVFGRRTGETGAVGARPAGATPEGVEDLAGNLAEWTSTLYRSYPYDSSDGREDPTAPGERVTRGGDYVYNTGANELTGYFRNGFSRAPKRGHRHIGFRCAR